MKILHPYEPHINKDKDTKFLIVGTIPPHRFCEPSKKLELEKGDIDWFYGSKDNNFWEIIASAFDKDISDLGSKDKRKSFANDHHIGFIDLFHQVYRYKESSSDADIIPISFNNICKYIKEEKSIKAVLFTSAYVEELTTSLLNEELKCCVNRNSKNGGEAFDNIKFDNRVIKWIRLKSPSPRNTKNSNDKKKEAEWKKIFKGK